MTSGAERQSRYYYSHREECLNRSKTWKEENPSRIREASRRYNWKIRTLAIKKLGGKCVVCGITDIRILQINHLSGLGNRETGDSHHQFYRDIAMGKRKIDDLDVRCANHNLLYEYEKGRLSIPMAVR